MRHVALLQTWLHLKLFLRDLLLPHQSFCYCRVEILVLSSKEKQLPLSSAFCSGAVCPAWGNFAVGFSLLVAGQQPARRLSISSVAFVFRVSVAVNAATVVQTKAAILGFKTVVQYLHREPRKRVQAFQAHVPPAIPDCTELRTLSL